MSSIRKEVTVTSPAGEAGEFHTVINIPRSNTQYPVTVRVLEVKTPKDISLLPAFEQDFILLQEISRTDTFDVRATALLFLTIDTARFNLTQSYNDMFNIRPVDFANAAEWKDVLNDPVEGQLWFEKLDKHYFNNRMMYRSGRDIALYQSKVLEAVNALDDPKPGMYTQVRSIMGPQFMARKRQDREISNRIFLKWLYLSAINIRQVLPSSISSNLPINHQIKIQNQSTWHMRFSVPPRGREHTLHSLFSTLPVLLPRKSAVSTGASFLPKDPFAILQLHSNLCNRMDITGREASSLLFNLFTGDEIVGFKRDRDLESLPLALGPGSQGVHFEILVKGLRQPLKYLNPSGAVTEIKLGFLY